MATLSQDMLSQTVSSQPQINTFHQFSRLPTEIRTIIFHYAALSLPPRTIEICLALDEYEPLPEKGHNSKKLAVIALNRTKYHRPRARTPALFHVSRHARAVALAMYRPCKASTFVVEYPWISALVPCMEEPVPPLRGSVFNPSKDTLFLAMRTPSSHYTLLEYRPYPRDLKEPHTRERIGGWGLEYLVGDLAAVAHIGSLAIICRNHLNVDRKDMKWIFGVWKKYKSLRELILVVFEDLVQCDVSRGLGLEIRKREVILLDAKDLATDPWRPALERALQMGQKWREAAAKVQAQDDDGWKAPEIMIKIAIRGK